MLVTTLNTGLSALKAQPLTVSDIKPGRDMMPARKELRSCHRSATLRSTKDHIKKIL